jgi:hypothetical protein
MYDSRLLHHAMTHTHTHTHTGWTLFSYGDSKTKLSEVAGADCDDGSLIAFVRSIDLSGCFLLGSFGSCVDSFDCSKQLRVADATVKALRNAMAQRASDVSTKRLARFSCVNLRKQKPFFFLWQVQYAYLHVKYGDSGTIEIVLAIDALLFDSITRGFSVRSQSIQVDRSSCSSLTYPTHWPGNWDRIADNEHISILN